MSLPIEMTALAFCKTIKVVYGPSHDTNRWRVYYHGLLNTSPTVALEIIELLLQHPVNKDFAKPPSSSEITAVIRKLKNNTAPGKDNRPTEIFRHYYWVSFKYLGTKLQE